MGSMLLCESRQKQVGGIMARASWSSVSTLHPVHSWRGFQVRQAGGRAVRRQAHQPGEETLFSSAHTSQSTS